jgi:hypothetical protein
MDSSAIPENFKRIPPPIIDGKPINMEWLTERVTNKDKLGLIRAMRFVTGCGLKEAKDEVESHCYFDPTFPDVSMTIQCFGKYIRFGNVPTRDEFERQAVVKGMNCALRNWSVLGFKTKYAACEIVLSNLLNGGR